MHSPLTVQFVLLGTVVGVRQANTAVFSMRDFRLEVAE